VLFRSLAPVGAWQHQASVLVNWGQARETDLNPRRDLSDVALGYVGKHSNGMLVKAYLAHRLSAAAQSESASRNRLVLQAGWVFCRVMVVPNRDRLVGVLLPVSRPMI
ncbi:hypothetical protein RZS08_04280, partial [Arthrospira platensis SPKY1]|nr:hypothetical protein [Arthrospira platensis SPKY1]